MPIDPQSLTREQIRDLIRRQRAGYEQMERDRLREEWREPTIEDKNSFSRLMQDVWKEHCRDARKTPSAFIDGEAELVVFYRKLLRLTHE